MSHCDDRKFEYFLKHALPEGSNLLTLEDSLFGNTFPDIIVCNNKINHLEKCGNLSYFFHCPILIVDHDTKPSFIDKDIIEYQSNSIYSVAINHNVYNSWGQKHNLVMHFDLKNPNNIDQWRNLLYQITKIPFSLKPKAYNNDNKDTK
jgi:hypothetical protein